MKIKLYALIVLLVVVLLLAIYIMNNKINKKVVINNTTSFRLFFTRGYMMNADIDYSYELKDGKYIMTVKPYLVAREDAKSFEVDKKVIKEIEDIINKYEVYRWNNFNKSDNDVLDGDSFTFSVSMNGLYINASGYMSYPDNYGNVREEVSAIFERELEKNK